MDRTCICLDSSILIDYFRKTQKEKTLFFQLTQRYDFAISVITKLEILNGANIEQQEFWNQVFRKCRMLPLGEPEIDEAILIIKALRLQNQMIELADILIAATAKVHQLKLATLNKKHFARIENLEIHSS